MKKRLLVVSLLVVIGCFIGMMSQPEKAYSQKERSSAVTDRKITADDIDRFLEIQTGANQMKRPPKPGTKYSFTDLAPWIKTIAALSCLGVFFYLIRKKF